MQLTVRTYATKFIRLHRVRRKFMELMREYDGSPDFAGAYYTLQVLHEKAGEAREWVEQHGG